MDELEVGLRNMVQQVKEKDFGAEHGAQEAFCVALGVPRSSFSLFVRGIRPGTNPSRSEGGDKRSLVQRLHRYLKRQAASAKTTKDYEFYFNATMVLWAFMLDDPDFLPETN